MKVPCLLTLAALALGFTSPVHADPALRRLTGHVPRAAIAHARPLGRVASQESVSLALTLPVRDQAGLDTLLRRLYTPGDPMQGRFLTPDEFARRFSPTAEDYAAVADFARRSGLTVTGTHPNRLVLDVAGPASSVERALGVRLGRYRGAQGRIFRAPDADPSVPAALAGRLAGVVGLDTLAVRRPHLRPALGGAAGSGRGGGLTPADVRNAYGLSGGATGAGQSIALFELDGYNPADIVVYRNTYGLPQMSLLNVLIDGVSGAAASWSTRRQMGPTPISWTATTGLRPTTSPSRSARPGGRLRVRKAARCSMARTQPSSRWPRRARAFSAPRVTMARMTTASASA